MVNIVQAMRLRADTVPPFEAWCCSRTRSRKPANIDPFLTTNHHLVLVGQTFITLGGAECKDFVREASH